MTERKKERKKERKEEKRSGKRLMSLSSRKTCGGRHDVNHLLFEGAGRRRKQTGHKGTKSVLGEDLVCRIKVTDSGASLAERGSGTDTERKRE